MTQQNSVVIDSRPSRETQYYSTFERENTWRLLSRTNKATQGGLAGTGFCVPTFISDVLAGGLAMELPTATGSTTSATTTTPVLVNQLFYLPANLVAANIPAQVMTAIINVGISVPTAGTGFITGVTCELVKVSSVGVVTSLGLQSITGLSEGAGSPSTYVNFGHQFNVTVSAASIAATDRLAIRVNTTGYNTSGLATSHVVNPQSNTNVSTFCLRVN